MANPQVDWGGPSQTQRQSDITCALGSYQTSSCQLPVPSPLRGAFSTQTSTPGSSVCGSKAYTSRPAPLKKSKCPAGSGSAPARPLVLPLMSSVNPVSKALCSRLALISYHYQLSRTWTQIVNTMLILHLRSSASSAEKTVGQKTIKRPWG